MDRGETEASYAGYRTDIGNACLVESLGDSNAIWKLAFSVNRPPDHRKLQRVTRIDLEQRKTVRARVDYKQHVPGYRNRTGAEDGIGSRKLKRADSSSYTTGSTSTGRSHGAVR